MTWIERDRKTGRLRGRERHLYYLKSDDFCGGLCLFVCPWPRNNEYNRETEKQIDRDSESNRETGRKTDAKISAQSESQRNRATHTGRQRLSNGKTDRDTEGQTEIQRHSERERKLNLLDIRRK